MDTPCFELKGSLFTLTVLQLFKDDLSVLEEQLTQRVKMAPDFFNHTPIVIDLHLLPEEKHEMDFFELRELLLSLSIIPVGVKGAHKKVHTLLEAAGMAVLAEAKNHKNERPAKTPAEKSEPKPEHDNTDHARPVATKTIRHTIRSGQQIYAPEGDLIVLGSVSPGAEVLADGNIHIYGTLRGRALAGVRGDNQTAIYCQNLQAELISIAGIYLLSEDLPEDKQDTSAQIFLQDDRLQITPIH